MPKTIRIRNVPGALHRRLEKLAAFAGLSLSDYLLKEIQALAEQPSYEEIASRLARRPSVELSVSPATAVRKERDSR